MIGCKTEASAPKARKGVSLEKRSFFGSKTLASASSIRIFLPATLKKGRISAHLRDSCSTKQQVVVVYASMVVLIRSRSLGVMTPSPRNNTVFALR